MRNKNTFKLLLPLAFSLLSFESKAFYYNHNYFGAKATMVIPSSIGGNSNLQSTSPKNTYSGSIFIGRKFMDSFAFELELNQRKKSDISNTSFSNNVNITNDWGVTSRTIMFNLTADLLQNKVLKPYVKAGVGLSQNKSDDYKYTEGHDSYTWQGKSSNSIAWSAGCGLDISTSKNIDTFIEYMFISRGKFKTQNGANFVSNGISGFDGSSSAKEGYLKEQTISFGFKVKF